MASASSLHVSMKIPISSTSQIEKCSYSLITYQRRKKGCGVRRSQKAVSMVKCESQDSPADVEVGKKVSDSLRIGSPIIIVEAPKVLKTAASMPSLRANSGLVKAGDVGRIMSRKPKDVWAVRLTIGTFLIDGKYFKPLKLDEDD